MLKLRFSPLIWALLLPAWLKAASTEFPFQDVTAASGVHFTHQHGGSGEKFFPESMGSGVLVADLNQDGHQDLYFVNGAALPGSKDTRIKYPNALYLGRGDGTFEDATEEWKAQGIGYGMGVSAADYDGDGDLDLYLTNFGANVLLRNDGGHFSDVTSLAGVGDPRWSVSSAWADMDGDEDLDLYVANYVDYSLENNKFCGKVQENLRSYCHPDAYPGISDRLYRNEGNGTFQDVTKSARVENALTKGLGVVWLDSDQDGKQDLYVANDSTINLLFRNLGNGRFEDRSLLSGAGYNEAGRSEASMGVDTADFNEDGLPDLFMTHLDLESNTLYISSEYGVFQDRSFPSGLAAPSLPRVGFGTVLADFDNDGDADIYVTNGHVIDNIHLFRPGFTRTQMDHFYRNQGKVQFQLAEQSQGSPRTGRGLAAGDFNEDGTLDLVVSNNEDSAQILLGQPVPGRNWLRVRLRGLKNRDGIGARVSIEAAGKRQWDVVRTGGSYASQNELELHFGLGSAEKVDKLEVLWPSGRTQVLLNLAVNQQLQVKEPEKQVVPGDEKP